MRKDTSNKGHSNNRHINYASIVEAACISAHFPLYGQGLIAFTIATQFEKSAGLA